MECITMTQIIDEIDEIGTVFYEDDEISKGIIFKNLLISSYFSVIAIEGRKK